MLNDWIGFIFRALVYGQVFFWWWLYDQNWLNAKISEHGIELLFNVGLPALAFRIAWNHYGISQYSPAILLQYCLLYYVAWEIYRVKYSWVQAVSLMGLTVFLNSYYWESILHIHEFKMILGFTPNMILQMVHLLPVAFFLKRFRFEKKESLDDLAWGFLISAIIGFISIRYLGWNPYSAIIPQAWRSPIKMILFFINRISCLFILIRVIFNAEPK